MYMIIASSKKKKGGKAGNGEETMEQRVHNLLYGLPNRLDCTIGTFFSFLLLYYYANDRLY